MRPQATCGRQLVSALLMGHTTAARKFCTARWASCNSLCVGHMQASCGDLQDEMLMVTASVLFSCQPR